MLSILAMSHLAPEQASSFAADVDHLYAYLWGWTIFFSIGIGLAILIFFIKYRRSKIKETPKAIEGSIILETTWTVVPFLIAMSLFAWGAKIYLEQYSVPRDGTDIYVVAKQWMWKFQHPEGQREINELHVPVGTKIRLIMTSEDVIHSFFVPAFRTKKDVVPGYKRYSTIWFEATKPGTYRIYCAEYCGLNHSGMIGWVHVMKDEDFRAWLSGDNAGGTMAERGKALFTQLGCSTCHRSDGGGQCPKLEGVFGTEQQMSDGSKVYADESYVRESVLVPTAKIVAGYAPIMPTFQGVVSEEQLQQLIAYVKSIGATPTTSTAKPAGSSLPAGGNGAAPNVPLMSPTPNLGRSTTATTTQVGSQVKSVEPKAKK